MTRVQKIILNLLKTVYTRELFADPKRQTVMAVTIAEALRQTPTYVRLSCLIFLFVFDWFYPLVTHEWCRFAGANDRGKRQKYCIFWNDFPFYYARLPFKVIFSITNLCVMGDAETLHRLGYEKDLLRKAS